MEQNNGKGKKSISINHLAREIKEAQKNPSFIKEVNKFIKASTSIYKI